MTVFLKRCFLSWNAASAALDFAGGSAIMMLQVCSFQMLLQMIFDINWLDCVLFNIVSWPKIVDDNYSCWKINKSEYTLIMKGRPNHFLRQFSSYVQRQANTEQNREAAALLLDRGLSNHIFPRLCLLDLILISTKCQLQLYKIELYFL